MNRIALLTVVELDIVFTIVGILAVVVIAVLLAILLVRLNKTVSKVNRLLDRKQDDIEQTISNLPALTKNISDVTGEVTKTVATVNGIADQVGGAVSSFFRRPKGPSPFTAAKKVVEVVRKKKSAKKTSQ